MTDIRDYVARYEAARQAALAFKPRFDAAKAARDVAARVLREAEAAVEALKPEGGRLQYHLSQAANAVISCMVFEGAAPNPLTFLFSGTSSLVEGIDSKAGNSSSSRGGGG